MPFKNGNIVPNATVWTEEMISFLKVNFYSMTNKQLASALKLRLTVTRNKCQELGLKRMQLEYWTVDMVQYLVDNYKTKGDVEIMNYFIKHHPKTKGWKRGAIRKKRKQMGLMRTVDDLVPIIKNNCKKGGPSYTIDKNSSAKNMHPKWIVQRIAWRDKEMQDELLKHPDLIAAAKQLILLKRELKKSRNEKSSTDTKANCKPS